ncbi:MAG: nucleoside hydrolase [Clostridia bacterium]|jgi:pyrimidine-specific ribonucleoside hydrolase
MSENINLIVETDIGGDPDDFFALCYLFEANVNIKAILISPGSPGQVAIVKFLLKELGKENVLVGVGDRNKGPSVGGMHLDILKKYKHPLTEKDDGLGKDIISEVYTDDIEFFICGPIKSIGQYLSNNNQKITRSTMQGGFIGYDIHGQNVPKLQKFENLTVCPTFNLGGDKKGAMEYIESKNILERNWIGKNICHTIIYDKNIHNIILSNKPKNRAKELFIEGMNIYLNKHSEKKFHDPSAAACMLHPEIATWVKGKLYYDKGKYGTILDENGDNIAINIDYDKLWEHIRLGE